MLTRLDEAVPTVTARPSRRNEDMSTNQRLTNPHRTTESTIGDQARRRQIQERPFDLSITQMVGGALAAMTAAALGSQLSAAGTVIGAALASIVAAVAGSLYTASLRRTSDKVKTVFYTEGSECGSRTHSHGDLAGQ